MVIKRPFLAGRLVKLLLKLHNFSYKGIGFLSQYLEADGIHPKHRIMKYHDWFTKHIKSNWFVLDIGCGNGALTSDIGLVARKVVGIDIEDNNIKNARECCNGENVEFVCDDVTTCFIDFKADCVVLSNILEHIEDRRNFLERLKTVSKRFLIRVPMLNRDWITPYKKEMSIEWRLDNTHYTEYTKESFYEEMYRAGMTIKEQEIMWGEIYSVVEAKNEESNNNVSTTSS
ncbi:MAG: class I SAM-dependent methyltransferase [Candidatus Scalindua sp.]